jgi:hypothetical protein
MFLCGNMCTGEGGMEPEVNVKEVSFEAKVMTAIHNFHKSTRPKKNGSVMVKKSRYDEYVKDCRERNVKFEDKEFPANSASLEYTIEGRPITWKRITEVVPGAVMVENDFTPSDIHQGNIGDCYFLSSIAALAEVEERIENIFHNDFTISPYGIYNILMVLGGVPTQIVIDDYIPVFADTHRPVFCKATGREIWVVLLEKAWAKLKGSYGAISAGCPHEVLQTFSVAPCYYYQVEEHHEESYKTMVWKELADAADENMAVVAGTKPEVKTAGLLPGHAYTILDSHEVKSLGKVHRMMRLRNPWGKTEYQGRGCETDNEFWNGVTDEAVKKRMRPQVGSNDGDFSMPFGEFMKNFNSIDISSSIFGFSYEFQNIKMYKGEPLFIKFDVTEEHEAFLTVERKYGKGDTNQQVLTTDYGFTRMIIGHQRDQDTFEYYDSILESDFPDCTTYVTFKPGRYVMFVEIDDPKLPDQFDATFSYYFDTLETKEGKNWRIEYDEKYPNFLESVFLNHALRMNNDKSPIGPKKEDWVKTTFNYDQGGFGYVMVNLQQDTNIRISVTMDRK